MIRKDAGNRKDRTRVKEQCIKGTHTRKGMLGKKRRGSTADRTVKTVPLPRRVKRQVIRGNEGSKGKCHSTDDIRKEGYHWKRRKGCNGSIKEKTDPKSGWVKGQGIREKQGRRKEVSRPAIYGKGKFRGGRGGEKNRQTYGRKQPPLCHGRKRGKNPRGTKEVKGNLCLGGRRVAAQAGRFEKLHDLLMP